MIYDLNMENDINKASLPQVGETYMFYDDGKRGLSRQYKATVLRIISKDEAKNVTFPTYCSDEIEYEENTIVYKDREPIGEATLLDVWKARVEDCDWLYAEDTDYFIECSIPRYDENSIWFVRTKEGNWFSIDIQCYWQAGLLEVE